MFFKVFGPLAQAIRRSQSKELKSFTKPKIGLQINHSTAWRGLGRPGATLQPGMSSTTSTCSSSTWTEEHHQELQENGENYPDQDNEAWWASYSGSKAAEIVEYFATSSSATSNDEHGPDTSPIKWWDYAPNEFQQAIDLYEAQQQGHQEFDMWDSFSEGSYRQTTRSRREDRHRLTAKELEKFDKEMKEFFKNYKSPICSESG